MSATAATCDLSLGMIEPTDCGGRYFFDAAAADRVCTFFEKYLVHYEDVYAGRPFAPIPWQRKMLRDLYGWKVAATGRRRYREAYVEIAKGNGKTPLLAGMGLYEMVAGGTPGAQVYSCGSNFQQANISFDAGKKMAELVPQLAGRLRITEFQIDGPRNAEWKVLSGSGRGKAGMRPDLVLFDEVHEQPNRQMYDSIASNLHKRSNPLMVNATNAGSDKTSLCWELHERAVAVLRGESDDETFYPVVFGVGEKDDWHDEANWVRANPSIGHCVSFDSLRLLHSAALGNPHLEARFRRFNLSQWLTGSDRWLNMSWWDGCTGKLPAEKLAGLPLWVGMDLSVSNDLSAIACVWADFPAGHYYARVQSYVPRRTGYELAEKLSLPMQHWHEKGHLRLLESETVDDDAHRRFARLIRKLGEKYDLRQVCYDRARASATVTKLEKKGVTCVPVNQSFLGIGPSTAEFERLLQAKQWTIRANPLLRWQASVVEVAADSFGNLRPVKQAARADYAGTRTNKIDGIVAMILALSGARQHALSPETEQWDGEIIVL